MSLCETQPNIKIYLRFAHVDVYVARYAMFLMKRFFLTSVYFLKYDTDRWLRLNGPVSFSYFYSKYYLKLVL